MSAPRTVSTLVVTVLLMGAPKVLAQDAPVPATARAAVNLAKSAFEYRDFERVVTLLYPWLHPRRILETRLAIDARELLGVSLHVLGRTEDAKEEFAELLLLDPRHKLDSFLVPPAVIQVFEDVRALLQPTLDRILRDRGVQPLAPPPTGPPTVEPVSVPALAIALLPLGVPQFAADEIGWGLLWAVLQVGFMALNIVAYDQAGRRPGEFALWTGLQFSGLAGFLAAWTASGIQGYSQLKAARQRAIDEARDALVAEPEPAPQAVNPPAESEAIRALRAPGPSIGLRWAF